MYCYFLSHSTTFHYVSTVLCHHTIITTWHNICAPLLSLQNHSDVLLPAFRPFYLFLPYVCCYLFLHFNVLLSTILIISTVSHGTLQILVYKTSVCLYVTSVRLSSILPCLLSSRSSPPFAPLRNRARRMTRAQPIS